MAEVSIESVSKQAKDLFNRGLQALERANYDYAIDMLSSCLELEPGVLQARKYLRVAEIQKRKEKKPYAVTVNTKSIPIMAKVLAMQKNKTDKALVAAEKLLQLDPLNTQFVLTFADTANLAGYPEAALHSLEVAKDHSPDDKKLLKKLSDLYLEAEDAPAARDCLARLHELMPTDADIAKAYKNAMALTSMSRDGWQQAAEGDGTYRDAMKSTDEATKIEQEAKSVKSDKDLENLIVETRAKIEAEPENINFYRALGRYYVQAQMFEEADGILAAALEKNPGDPELDQQLSNIRRQWFDYEIARHREAGDEDGALKQEQEKAQFVLDDLGSRVERYPNDLRLKYEYGVVLFENEHVNDAIQQFQASQRSPKNRTLSLLSLARCFRSKGQFDLASRELENAAKELVLMDNTKKEILYELGSLAEEAGDTEKAISYYKDVYQADIGFKDVAQKVEQLYST